MTPLLLLCTTRADREVEDEIGARLRLNGPLARRLLTLRERYALDTDLDVSQVVLYDQTPELWVRWCIDETSELETLLEAGEWTRWSSYLGHPPTPDADLRTECDELVLSRIGVWWQFEKKHSDVRRETCILSWTLIEEVAAG